MTIYCPECGKPKRWWQPNIFKWGKTEHTWVSKNGSVGSILGIRHLESPDTIPRLKASHEDCALKQVHWNPYSRRAMKEAFGRPPQ